MYSKHIAVLDVHIFGPVMLSLMQFKLVFLPVLQVWSSIMCLCSFRSSYCHTMLHTCLCHWSACSPSRIDKCYVFYVLPAFHLLKFSYWIYRSSCKYCELRVCSIWPHYEHCNPDDIHVLGSDGTPTTLWLKAVCLQASRICLVKDPFYKEWRLPGSYQWLVKGT